MSYDWGAFPIMNDEWMFAEGPKPKCGCEGIVGPRANRPRKPRTSKEEFEQKHPEKRGESMTETNPFPPKPPPLQVDMCAPKEGLGSIPRAAINPSPPKKVEVHFLHQSEPVIMTGVENAYQKGDLYCVILDDSTICKFPIAHVLRIKESN